MLEDVDSSLNYRIVSLVFHVGRRSFSVELPSYIAGFQKTLIFRRITVLYHWSFLLEEVDSWLNFTVLFRWFSENVDSPLNYRLISLVFLVRGR